MFDEFVQYLNEALLSELPGAKSHKKLMPPGRELIWKEDNLAVTHSSVLFLIFPIDCLLYTILIKRPGNMKNHPGQIGFPGGKVEEEDENPQAAAMREAQEELGLLPNSYRIMGKLSDLYLQVSNFIVHPYVAWAEQKPDLKINNEEVERIVLFPLSDFLAKEELDQFELDIRSEKLIVPCYPFGGEIIWGGTAMILSEFFDVIRNLPSVEG